MWKRWGGPFLLVIGGVILLLWMWPLVRPVFQGGVQAAALLLSKAGLWGPLLVIGLQALQAVVSPLPSWPITVAAGAQYGPWMGSLYSLVGGMIGAAINFVVGRTLGQPLVKGALGQRWVDRAATLSPLHFLVLALFGRLLPVASFDLVAYLAGVGRIGLWRFLGVALVGQAPAFYAYAFLGSDLARAQSAGLWSSLLLLLLVALILAGNRLWRYLIR